MKSENNSEDVIIFFQSLNIFEKFCFVFANLCGIVVTFSIYDLFFNKNYHLLIISSICLFALVKALQISYNKRNKNKLKIK